ncbi:hypothetical protein [Streptomyces sp. ISL-100]|uniref:hypothetical protein n=1 Tax=Streptomyces sp. ISL-100 TaxID=2819173 RepID=UPI001BE5FCEF|nr:hypothetical protein [Streptomyces sp. ISL-100]MBT2399775.1 hypothetical protein [Streptomyces sp. ISL-100]
MSWLNIDYDSDTWLKIPGRWTDVYNEDDDGVPTDDDQQTPAEWAAETAQDCWDDSGIDSGETGVAFLAETLQACVEKYPQAFPGYDIVLHLPDPRAMPLPVYVTDFPIEGDREPALRLLAMADDKEAVEPPIVEEFTTEDLGQGLRVLRYFTMPNSTDLLIGLRYAWRSEKFDRDLVMITASPAPGRVLSALEDIDDLARSIRLRADNDLDDYDSDDVA